MVTGVIPSPPRFLPSIFIAHRVQQSHCSSIFHRTLLTHALALSASQFVHKKKSQRIYTSMHSAGLELTKLTYTRLKDNLIRHRGDRSKKCICLCRLYLVQYQFVSALLFHSCTLHTSSLLLLDYRSVRFTYNNNNSCFFVLFTCSRLHMLP